MSSSSPPGITKSLHELLPIKDNQTGILIKWNRDDGVFEVYFEGQPIHIDSMEVLTENIVAALHQVLDKNGMIIPSLPEGKRDDAYKESLEEDDLPAWLED